MDYNTQRKKLIMPEYGRHVQKMVEYVQSIEDKDKRNEQIKAVLSVMGIINPQLRDINDFKHKMWDHIQIISNFNIDIDSPYPIPTKETFTTKPSPIPLSDTPLKEAHYGRNIQNMIEMISAREDGEVKSNMIKILAAYMRQQYLIWNKDTVTEEIIFRDIFRLSGGKLSVPEDIHLNPISQDANFQQPRMMVNTSSDGQHKRQFQSQHPQRRNFRNSNKGKHTKN